jgi:hypothetical protein
MPPALQLLGELVLGLAPCTRTEYPTDGDGSSLAIIVVPLKWC